MPSLKIKDGSNEFRKNIGADLFAFFVFTAVLLVFYPVGVYQQNTSAVIFNLSDLWGEIFKYAAVFFFFGAGVSIFLRKVFKINPAPLFAGLWLCMWIQGNLLDYNMGSLNGQAMEWDSFVSNLFREIVIWLAALGASFYFRKRINANARFIFAAILIFEGAPLLINGAIQYINENKLEKLYFDRQNEFEYSSSKNAIIIVLDAARGTLAAQTISENEALRASFKDFTIYENASAGYTSTKPSIPLALSGIYNINKTTFAEYEQNSVSISLPHQLQINGYAVEYYSFAPFIYANQWSNASITPSSEDLKRAAYQLYSVSSLRYSPLLFKPFLFNKYFSGKYYWTRDMIEFHENANNARSSRQEPVFKLIHLSGAHQPFQLDSSVKRVEKSNYKDQLTAGLVVAADLLEALKENGAYENSLILIISDHGWNGYAKDLKIYSENPSDMMLYGIPLIMAKEPARAQTALQISDAPVSLADISKSVLSSLEIENDNAGYSIFSEIPQDRERYYYHYEWTNLDWNAPYLPDLIEYKIIGDVRKEESWIRTGNIFSGGERDK